MSQTRWAFVHCFFFVYESDSFYFMTIHTFCNCPRSDSVQLGACHAHSPHMLKLIGLGRTALRSNCTAHSTTTREHSSVGSWQLAVWQLASNPKKGLLCLLLVESFSLFAKQVSCILYLACMAYIIPYYSPCM